MSKIKAGRAFRDAHIAELRNKSYQDIAEMPTTVVIATPPSLRGLLFKLRKKNHDDGGIEVEVEMMEKFLLIFAGKWVNGFTIYPDGRIADMHDYAGDIED